MSESRLSEIQDLFELQEVDAALVRLRARLVDSDESRRAGLIGERLQKAVLARKLAASAVAKSESALKRCELDLAEVEGNVEALRAKIYGGEVKNPKELAALEDRLNIEVRKKENLEENVLHSMERLEESRAQLEKIERVFPKIKGEYEAAQAELDQAKAEWNAEAARLEERRAAIVTAINPRMLKVYEALIPSTKGRPVARVINRTCDGCHVELPTSARIGETARCLNCGRLLWWNE